MTQLKLETQMLTLLSAIYQKMPPKATFTSISNSMDPLSQPSLNCFRMVNQEGLLMYNMKKLQMLKPQHKQWTNRNSKVVSSKLVFTRKRQSVQPPKQKTSQISMYQDLIKILQRSNWVNSLVNTENYFHAQSKLTKMDRNQALAM